MRKRYWIPLATLLAVPLLLILALTLLLATEPGLNFSLQMAQRFAPGELAWGKASGRLIGPVQLDAVEYADDSGRYSVGRFAFDWSPGRLLARRLSIHQLHVEGVEIALPEADAAQEEPAAPIEPGWSLPLEIVVRDLALANLRVTVGAAEPVVVDELTAAFNSGLEWIDFERFALRMDEQFLGARGRLGLGRQVATELNLELRSAPPGVQPIAATGTLTGTWEQLQLRQELSAPVALQLALDIDAPFADLRWALDLTLPVSRLDQIAADLPPLRLGGRLRGSGGLRDAELGADLQTDWEADELYPLRLDLTLAEADDGSLQLRPLVIHQGDARLRLTGSWVPGAEDFNARLEGQSVRWPLTGTATVKLPEAEVKLAGRITDYRLDVSARVEAAEFPSATLTARGQGSDQALALEAFSVNTLEGVIDGSGQLAWAPALTWDFQLAARDINPGPQWPEWPGKLAARVQTQGAESPAGLDLQARIESLSGVLRGYPVSATGAVHRRGDITEVQDVELRSGDARLAVAGSVADQIDLRFDLQAADLQQLVPATSGRVNATGSLSGASDQPRLRVNAKLGDLATGQLRLAQLNLDADLGLQPGSPLKLIARGTSLSLDARRFDSLEADLDGSLERHNLRLRAQGASHGLELAAAGGWNGSAWNGRLERGDWRIPELGAWNLEKAVAVQLGNERGAVDALCWRQRDARLCADVAYDPQLRRVQARLDDWPLADALRAYLPPGVEVADAALGFTLDARQPAQGPPLAAARLEVSAGTLSWAATGDRRENARFRGADADLKLDAAGAASHLEVRLSGTDRLQGELRLPGYRPGDALDRQRLQGRVQGEVRDFALFEGMLDKVDDLSGVMRLDAALSGTPADPGIDGELRLVEGRAFIGNAGIQLEDLQLVLSGDRQTDALTLAGSARSGPGTLRLDGRLAGLGGDALEGHLQLAGEAFEAVNLPEARVLVTPDMRIDMRAPVVNISGTVHIPEARIEPRDVSGAQTPSKDVVLVRAGEEPPPPKWQINTRLKLTLGDKVQFSGFGLDGRLTGALDVVDEARRVTRARGELRVVDGTYTAYGQELTIETGRVLYRDGPIDNPGLDVRAVRRTGDILAGVKVFGSAQSPELELYSKPSLPQADQLSYLLLGRPVQGASGSEGQLLFKAASSLGLKGGNLLAESIGSTFGLDEVSVGGGDDLENAALVIGKYLSPRLYINYSVGLLDAVNKLQIRYQLSRRLSVQTETGTATGGDILYTLER